MDIGTTNIDLKMDTSSPPPLSCLGTSNIYNVDIGHSIWHQSNDEDIFSTDSANNLHKDSEKELNEHVKGDTLDVASDTTDTLDAVSDTTYAENICGNSELNVNSDNDEKKTVEPCIVCDNDVQKPDNDDEFGEFEENSDVCGANVGQCNTNECKYDSDIFTDNIIENEELDEIKIPTIYSDNDDEFNDFSKSKDDSDDDFTAFAGSQDDFDDFTAFESKDDFTTCESKDIGNDDFEFGTYNTFDSLQESKEICEKSDQLKTIDNTADTNSALTFDPNHIPLQAKTDDISSHSSAVLDKLDCLISRWIGNTTKKENNCDVSLLCEYVEEDAFIWHHLVDVESSLALKLTWNNLNSKKHFLNSIDVDARNILYKNKWNASIPIFAQTLSFSPLTPARFKEKSGNNWSTNVIQSVPQQVDKHEPQTEGIIPPAKFDWSSSGLTNPLETPAYFSPLLDFDFLLTRPNGKSKVTSHASSIEKEILTASPHEVKTDQPTIIQRLMESQVAANKSTPLSAMRPDVKKIISQLPDLSFMKSKVFMFPINQT